MSYCIQCGGQLPDGARFCPSCGSKQVKTYTQVFRRNGLPEDQFIDKINAWFAAYPQVANVECRFETDDAYGALVNKFILNALAIRYECLTGGNVNQYALVHLQHFGLRSWTTEKMLEEWKTRNPGAIVVNCSGGIHRRGSGGFPMKDGFGDTNKSQLYVFFKFNRRLGTGVVPPSP